MFLLLILQGCNSLSVASNQTSSSGDYNPLTLPSVDPEKYKSDKSLCFKQVEAQNSKDMGQNYNVVKFRECLIQKGYVLLSWSVSFIEPTQTPHSSPTEPLEIQTDWHHSPMKSPTLRSQGSWVRSPPAAPLLLVSHHTALQRTWLWVGAGFLGFSHIETSDLTQTGVGLGRPMLPQFWISVGRCSLFLGIKSTDQNQNPRGITGLPIDGSSLKSG